jgi:hypothetical protein
MRFSAAEVPQGLKPSARQQLDAGLKACSTSSTLKLCGSFFRRVNTVPKIPVPSGPALDQIFPERPTRRTFVRIGDFQPVPTTVFSL